MKFSRDTLRFCLFVAAIFLMVFLGRGLNLDTVAVQRWVDNFPAFPAGLFFICAYVVLTFFIWLSKDLLRLAAAVAFGPYLSTLYVFIAEIFNAGLLFYFSRFLGRDFTREALGKYFRGIDEKLSGSNFFWLFLLRAVPLVPFRFMDMVMGLTGISFRRYLSVVILASPLRIFWLQFTLAGVGKAALDDPAALSAYLLNNRWLFLLTFVYLLLAVLVGIKIGKRGKICR